MKQLLTSILLLISIHTFAQFTSGTKVVSGTLSLKVDREPNSPNGSVINKINTFNVAPTFGVLVTNNLEVGGQVGYSSVFYNINYNNGYVYELKSNNMYAGVYAQRYVTITDKFLFSLTGNFTYGAGKSTTKTTDNSGNAAGEDEAKTNTYGINITPNFIFFPSNNWAITASIGNLGYSHTRNKEDDLKSNTFGINYGTLGLGISYYIR